MSSDIQGPLLLSYNITPNGRRDYVVEDRSHVSLGTNILFAPIRVASHASTTISNLVNDDLGATRNCRILTSSYLNHAVDLEPPISASLEDRHTSMLNRSKLRGQRGLSSSYVFTSRRRVPASTSSPIYVPLRRSLLSMRQLPLKRQTTGASVSIQTLIHSSHIF